MPDLRKLLNIKHSMTVIVDGKACKDKYRLANFINDMIKTNDEWKDQDVVVKVSGYLDDIKEDLELQSDES